MKGGFLMIDELYQLYHKDVYYYIFSLCKNQTLSEDLTSETFYQVMLSLTKFEGRSDIKTWIFSIARHVTYKEFKKRKIEISTNVLPDIPYFEDYKSQYMDIIELLNEQSEVYQKIFLLRLDGYSFEEIGYQVNMNPHSVRVVYHRVRMYLKEKLERGEANE